MVRKHRYVAPGLLRLCLRAGSSLVGLWWLAAFSAGAAAQARSQSFRNTAASEELALAALLATEGAARGDTELDRTIHDVLAELNVVQIKARPELDLAAEQLAVGCDDETPQCLREIAAQSHVDVLIAPILHRTAKGIELEIIAFDAREGGGLRRAVRHQVGPQLTQETLAAVPDQLRELFEVDRESARSTQPGATNLPTPQAEARAAPSDAASGRLPLVPVVLTGGGVLLIGAGIVVGAIMQHTEHQYAHRDVISERDAADTAQTLSQGRAQAQTANVLFGLGGAALAAGGIWLTIALTRDHEQTPRLALYPAVGSRHVGVVLVQHAPSL